MPRRCSLDYETRSVVDLKLAGAYVYARDPSTSVLCAAYCIDDGDVEIWPAAAGHKMPPRLRKALLDPKCEMHAWNSQFERLITKHVVGIDVPSERWFCTAAWARASGLPGKLETALEFTGQGKLLTHKRDGHRIMLKWCRPLPEDEGGGWADDGDEYMALVAYCMDDVRSEMFLQDYLRPTPMSRDEREDFLLCERINDRGLPIDRELALAAQAYGENERTELSLELKRLTDGKVSSISQHQRLKYWLVEEMGEGDFAYFFHQCYESHGKLVRKVSTDKRARGEFLLSSRSHLFPLAREVVDTVHDASKASVAKFGVMMARAADNGRAEGSYLAFGAIQTKRYSSRGVQAHNFPRTVPEDVESAIASVYDGTLEDGEVMRTLSSLLRPTIKALPGRTLVWGDWSSVEARGMPWLAGCEWKLDLYRQGLDVYRVNARDIFGVVPEEASDHQRQIGKVSELSLQFGGAVGALKSMARNYDIGLADADALRIVVAWRDANKWAMRFSKSLEAAYYSVLFSGREATLGYITYGLLNEDTVVCSLPDGTRLYYPGNNGPVGRAKEKAALPGNFGDLRSSRHDWETRTIVRRLLARHDGSIVHKDVQPPMVEGEVHETYAKHNPTSIDYLKAGAAHFGEERVWHGLLAENVTQALCAALLRDCLRRTEAALAKARLDAFIIGHTHDEIILESADGHALRAKEVLRREMVRVPKWLSGFPLGCDVKTGPRYVK